MPFTTYPSIEDIFIQAGLLYWNPTGFVSEAQYGTLLGYTENGLNFEPNEVYIPITEEETGEEVKKLIYVGSTPQITCTLQSWNANSIARAFPLRNSGVSIKHPNTILAGKALDADSNVYAPLLFVPDDTSNNKCILFQKVVPHLIQNTTIKWSHKDRSFLNLIFHALRKTNDADGIYYVGLLSGAVLR